jgi:hypothetical protein
MAVLRSIQGYKPASGELAAILLVNLRFFPDRRQPLAGFFAAGSRVRSALAPD